MTLTLDNVTVIVDRVAHPVMVTATAASNMASII